MRWNHFVRNAMVLTLAVGLVACGDDSDDPTDPGDELTQAEAEIMMEALFEAGGFFVTGTGGGPAGVVVTVDETVGCPGGGNVNVSGSLDIDEQTGNFDYTITQTHNNCTSTAPSDGSTWTFDGNPNVTIDLDATVSETAFDMNGSQTGAISWSGKGKNGSCSIDITYDFSGSQDGSSFSGSIQGSVCGISISDNISISD